MNETLHKEKDIKFYNQFFFIEVKTSNNCCCLCRSQFSVHYHVYSSALRKLFRKNERGHSLQVCTLLDFLYH